MGRLDGKVAFITGAARGQGRSHAAMLAAEGADIIGVDVCRQIDSVPYPLASRDDLDETVKLVENAGRRMCAFEADVRDFDALDRAVADGVAELGRLDIVLANAGALTITLGAADSAHSRTAFRDGVDILLFGVWNTLQVTVPRLIAQGSGGSIVITSSSVALRTPATDGHGGADAYTAAKHAAVGLMRGYANYLGPHNIRVNTIHPTGVLTPMIMNEFFAGWMEANPIAARTQVNALPVEAVDPEDISRAICFLVSDDGRYITGSTFSVDAGVTIG
jgi:SDR family mycofactocin-dependent oxidoreductase